MPSLDAMAHRKRGKLDRGNEASSRSRPHRGTKLRRRTRRNLDPEYKPSNNNCDAWLCSSSLTYDDFTRRRSSRLCRQLRPSHENALDEALELIHRNEFQETASEISDFLDLDDEIFGDLDLYEGVDCAPNHASVVSKPEFIGMVDDYSPPEKNPKLERLRTPTKRLPKREQGIKKSQQECRTSSTRPQDTVNQKKKSSKRRKGSNNICPVCQKSFQQLGHLRSHLLLHTGERPFVCEICSKSFAQSGHLISHINSHTSNRPYRCDFCDKRFTQSGHKRNHERSHLGIRLYGCVHCDKRFTQSGHLVNHLRIHDGEKPYKCDICGRTFTQSGHLSNHKKTHSESLDPDH